MLRASLVFTLALAGCIAEPSVVLREDDPNAPGRAVPVSGEGDDAMVLIPATVLAAPGSLAPNGPGGGGGGGGGNEDGDKKGKGKDKDAGAPPPSDPSGDPPAPSASETTVPAFWLDVREVSAAAYDGCVRAGACAPQGTDAGCTSAATTGAHPASCVTLDQAKAFCAWRGKRLPTNDEFTAAAAGASGRPYPWGADAPSAERLNACGAECGSPSMYPEDDGYPRTSPRGIHPAGRTPEGVFDLAGNVAEWVDLGGASVVRGGSFQDVDAAQVSSRAVRDVPVGSASVAIGFRCAKDS